MMTRPPIDEIRRTSEAVANYKHGSENEPGQEARTLATMNIALLDYIAFLEKGFEELASRVETFPGGGSALTLPHNEYIHEEDDPNLHAAVSQAKERI